MSSKRKRINNYNSSRQSSSLLRLAALIVFVTLVRTRISQNGGPLLVVDAYIIPPQSTPSNNYAVTDGGHTNNNNNKDELLSTYEYIPTMIHPEMCRYLSAKECQEADMAMINHGRKHQERQRLRQLNPELGNFKALVILLQFQDHIHKPLLDPQIYNQLWNGGGVGASPHVIPSGSITRWLQLNSYGLYELEATITSEWLLSDNTELYYSFGTSGLKPEFQKSFWPALDQLHGSGIDWSEYDMDQDGKIDCLVVLHSGYAAEHKGEDCLTGRTYRHRIWSHAFATSNNSDVGYWTAPDGSISVDGYVVASGFHGTCDATIPKIGIMTHELMHTFGLPDLYDGSNAEVGRGLGAYDIMASPYGPKGDSSWPGHLSTWSRIQLGWVVPIEVTQDGLYSLQCSEISNQAYIIKKNFPRMEYLLIENRQPLWYDSRLWTGGLLIYHIDDRANLMLKRGYPGQEGWPRNGNHYRVSMLPADGQYDLEHGANNGDANDFWSQGMELGPGGDGGRIVFPNTDSYQFGSIRHTGIRIYDISASDTIMTFRVSGVSTPQETSPEAPTEQTNEDGALLFDVIEVGTEVVAEEEVTIEQQTPNGEETTLVIDPTITTNQQQQENHDDIQAQIIPYEDPFENNGIFVGEESTDTTITVPSSSSSSIRRIGESSSVAALLLVLSFLLL